MAQDAEDDITNTVNSIPGPRKPFNARGRGNLPPLRLADDPSGYRRGFCMDLAALKRGAGAGQPGRSRRVSVSSSYGRFPWRKSHQATSGGGAGFLPERPGPCSAFPRQRPWPRSHAERQTRLERRPSLHHEDRRQAGQARAYCWLLLAEGRLARRLFGVWYGGLRRCRDQRGRLCGRTDKKLVKKGGVIYACQCRVGKRGIPAEETDQCQLQLSTMGLSSPHIQSHPRLRL